LGEVCFGGFATVRAGFGVCGHGQADGSGEFCALSLFISPLPFSSPDLLFLFSSQVSYASRSIHHALEQFLLLPNLGCQEAHEKVDGA
jgi:hypothetical protein